MSNKELRPKKLEDYIGQEDIKEQLSISIEASKKRNRQLPHTLFFGGAGLGKTTLSTIVATEFGSNIFFANAANIQTQADLLSYLVSLEEGDFLFIDEIHQLKNEFAEMMYTVMEDFRADIVTRSGTDMTPISLTIPTFTLIGATTLKGRLTQPFIDRFGIKIELVDYTNEELMKIIQRSSKLLGTSITNEASEELSKCSRGTPRKAIHLLDRVIDFAVVKDIKQIDKPFTENVLRKIKIDKYGLDDTDRHILKTIKEHFNGGPVGLNNLSATSGQQKDTLEATIEPYLLKNKFLIRTGRGRKITQKGLIALANF
jgi:Holliday junction DNA helicase RuvB